MNSTVLSSVSTTTKIPAAARTFLSLLERLQIGRLDLITPEGSRLEFNGKEQGTHANIQIKDWGAISNIMKSGDIGVAEAYRDNKIDTTDLLALLMLGLENQSILEKALHGNFLGTVFYRLRHLLNRNTRSGSKKNIHAHYDIGNDFYRLWLDSSMTYSAAIFQDDTKTLQQAQHIKYDRLLDMLDVKRGDHVLEIGCGWGALAEYAAITRGCYVTGISLSREQLAWARDRVKGTPAEGRTHFQFLDYRDLIGKYDAVISIEMFEAVGESYWPSYFKTVSASLRPGGRAAIQTITIDNDRFNDYRRGTDFIQQYIFPGGMLPSPQRFEKAIHEAGMKLEQLHEFGVDYAKTLRLWRENFEKALEEVRALGFDEAFIRLWRFYFCYCEAGFLSRRTDVCQAMISARG